MTYNILGAIYKPTGVTLTDKDGFEYPEMEQVEGYFVNVLDATEELKPYIVTPEQPVRKFAGRGDTVFLMFKDRDEWLSLGIEKIEEEVANGN